MNERLSEERLWMFEDRAWNNLSIDAPQFLGEACKEIRDLQVDLREAQQRIEQAVENHPKVKELRVELATLRARNKAMNEALRSRVIGYREGSVGEGVSHRSLEGCSLCGQVWESGCKESHVYLRGGFCPAAPLDNQKTEVE